MEVNRVEVDRGKCTLFQEGTVLWSRCIYEDIFKDGMSKFDYTSDDYRVINRWLKRGFIKVYGVETGGEPDVPKMSGNSPSTTRHS